MGRPYLGGFLQETAFCHLPLQRGLGSPIMFVSFVACFPLLLICAVLWMCVALLSRKITAEFVTNKSTKQKLLGLHHETSGG